MASPAQPSKSSIHLLIAPLPAVTTSAGEPSINIGVKLLDRESLELFWRLLKSLLSSAEPLLDFFSVPWLTNSQLKPATLSSFVLPGFLKDHSFRMPVFDTVTMALYSPVQLSRCGQSSKETVCHKLD